MDTGTSNGELPGWRGEEGQKHREEDEKRREIVYLIRCQPQIKLGIQFKELND